MALMVGGLASSLALVGDAGASSNQSKSVVISTTTNTSLGTILASGTTVYTLQKASKISCGTKCLKVWPVVVLPKGVTKAKAGTGVNASKLGTKKRGHGVRQVTYGGKALYWFSLDKAPGQVNGNITDKWGTWYVVVIAGPAGAPTTSSTAPKPAAGVTTTPTTSKPSTPRTTPTNPPTTTPPTSPPPTTTPTTAPPTTTTTPPTTTTTSPGGGGIGF